jgi:hypothetical protein
VQHRVCPRQDSGPRTRYIQKTIPTAELGRAATTARRKWRWKCASRISHRNSQPRRWQQQKQPRAGCVCRWNNERQTEQRGGRLFSFSFSFSFPFPRVYVGRVRNCGSLRCHRPTPFSTVCLAVVSVRSVTQVTWVIGMASEGSWPGSFGVRTGRPKTKPLYRAQDLFYVKMVPR